jgi:hypothetical protein
MTLSTALRLTGAAVLVAGYCAAVGTAAAQPAPTPAPAPGPAPTDAPAAPAAAPAGDAPKTTIDGNGTFKVGTDIVPGTYTSAGPVPDQVCYWKRTAGDKLVDNAMTKKPAVVQIDATDSAFTTSDCQTWTLSNCMPGCAPPKMGPADLIPGLLQMMTPG